MSDRWATFDCYGTLIDWNAGIATALERIFPKTSREKLLDIYHDVEPEVEAREPMPYADVLTTCALEIARKLGVSIPAGSARELPASPPSWPPFEEVPTSLQELRAEGWKIAILSNTDPELLDASIHAIGVDPDVRITFADAGSYKPALGHWEAFFRVTGAAENRHVHVAASLFHDIEPCARMGIAAVWINRLGESSDLPRNAEMTDLSGLAAALARIVPA